MTTVRTFVEAEVYKGFVRLRTFPTAGEHLIPSRQLTPFKNGGLPLWPEFSRITQNLKTCLCFG